MTYYNTLLFSFELRLLYEHLKSYPQITSVCQIVSAIPQDNGVCFYWQGNRYRVNWHRRRWYLSAKKTVFWASTPEELIDFCWRMTSISDN